MTHKYFWWVIYIFFGQLDELNNIRPKNAYPKIFGPKVISKSLWVLHRQGESDMSIFDYPFADADFPWGRSWKTSAESLFRNRLFCSGSGGGDADCRHNRVPARGMALPSLVWGAFLSHVQAQIHEEGKQGNKTRVCWQKVPNTPNVAGEHVRIGRVGPRLLGTGTLQGD